MGELAFQIFDIFLVTIAAITAVAVIQARSLFAATMLAGFYSLVMALIWQNMDAVDVSFTEAAVGAGISTILLLGALVFVGTEEKPRKEKINISALILVCLTGAALAYGTMDMPRFGKIEPERGQLHILRTQHYLSQKVGNSRPLGTEPDRRHWHGGAPAPAQAKAGGPAANSADPAHAQDGKPPAGANDAQGAQEHGDDWKGDVPNPVTVVDDHHHAHDDHHHPHATDDWDGHVPNTVTAVLAGYRSFDTMLETAVIFTAGMGLVILLRRRREDGEPAIEQNDKEGSA